MNKNSGAKLELKKVNKQTKETKIQQPPQKLIIEQKPKQKNKSDKKSKNDQEDVTDDKDKISKKKDKKGKDEQKQDQKLDKSTDKKNKKEKQQKQDKKDKKDKKQNKDKKDKKDKKKGQDEKEQSQLKKSYDKNESTTRKRSDKQLQTINKIHNSENKAKRTIEQLIQQYKTEAQRLLFHNKGHDPEKQKAIQKQLEQLKKQKQKRHQKVQMFKEKKQDIQKSKQKAKQVRMELRKQKNHQKRIKKVQDKLSTIENNAEQRRKDYQKFIQYVKERKRFKPRFKKYEEEYQEYLRQQQQDYRDKLDELSRKYQPMNIAQMTNFQQNYMAQKEQGLQYRQNKLKLQQDLIKQENERRQRLLWKGNCHRNVSEQQSQRLKKKKQPWQKLQTIKQYGKFIAENLKRQKEVPQDQNGKQNDEQQQKKDERIAYHQRYVKGVNYGLVPYEKPSPLSLQQKVKQGNKYLQEIRQLNKHRKNKTVDYSNVLSNRKLSASDDLKKDNKIFKLKRRSNPYYPTQQNKKQIDFKNYESIEFSIEKLNALKKDRELNDQIVKHGQYGSILDIQERKRRGGSLVIKQINQKLNILKKL